MADVIFRYGNETAFWNRLASLGMAERKAEDGSRLKLIDRGFLIMTPVLEDIHGNKYQRARMDASDADKFPDDNNPAFAIVWRSDETTEENENPEPMVEVTEYDENGDEVGTRMQAVGGF